MIDQKTVSYISALSRLHVDEADAGKFAKDLEAILGYVEKLNALDVSDVRPTSHVLNVQDVFREDVLKKGLSQEEALAFAVEKMAGAYKVPKVIE